MKYLRVFLLIIGIIFLTPVLSLFQVFPVIEHVIFVKYPSQFFYFYMSLYILTLILTLGVSFLLKNIIWFVLCVFFPFIIPIILSIFPLPTFEDIKKENESKSFLRKRGYLTKDIHCQNEHDNHHSKNVYKGVIFSLKEIDKQKSTTLKGMFHETSLKYNYQIIEEIEFAICDMCIDKYFGSGNKLNTVFISMFGNTESLEQSRDIDLIGSNETDRAIVNIFSKYQDINNIKPRSQLLFTRTELANMLNNGYRPFSSYTGGLPKLIQDYKTGGGNLNAKKILSYQITHGGNISFIISNSLSGYQMASLLESTLSHITYIGKYFVDAIIYGMQNSEIEAMIKELRLSPKVLEIFISQLKGKCHSKVVENVSKDILKKAKIL